MSANIIKNSILRRGFSLLELSMVLVISGLMVSFVLQANKQAAPASDCYITTRAQMNAIRNAIEIFARRNDRLPLPAPRNVGIESIKYGRESTAGSADIDTYSSGTSASISFGALPFQALGLSPSYASDCWGNKFTYAVTTALTASTSAVGFLDTSVDGNITVKSGTAPASTITTKAAYAIISHGEDGIGAVKSNYSAANPAHAWCLGATALKHYNCNIAGQLANPPFNNGSSAGANYFDDIIVTSGRPQLISRLNSAYCWGDNTYGQVGDGTNTQRAYATLVTPPAGQQRFVAISSGETSSCALTATGLPYCWGLNSSGQLGNGNNNNSSEAVAVSMPTGVTAFTSITVGANHACGLANDGYAYCWGRGGEAQLGLGGGDYNSYNTPKKVPRPSGVTTINQISAGKSMTCFTAATGDVWCSGDNATGRAGTGSTGGTNAFTKSPRPGGVAAFTKVSVGSYNNTCKLADTGDVWCAGRNDYGQIGNGTTSGVESTNLQVIKPAGVAFFSDVASGDTNTCALANTGDIYCWGGNFGPYRGENGDVAGSNRSQPTVPVAVPFGVSRYLSVWAQADSQTMCAVADDFNVYCWGYNASNQIGNGNAVDQMTPTKVVQDVAVVGLGAMGGGRCALKPLPAAGWNGINGWGIVGDGTTSKTAVPHWSWPSSQPDNHFIYVSGGGLNRCGITDYGNAYCWGANNQGQIGDGTTTTRSVPTKVIFPAGVAAWKEIATVSNRTYAIAVGGLNDGKLYGWGQWIGTTPTAFTGPCGGGKVRHIYTQYYGTIFICDNETLSYDGSGAGVSAVPAGTTKIIAVAKNYYQSCMLGDTADGAGQVYCNSSGYSGNVIGDGSAQGTASGSFVRVPPTGTATKFTALAAVNDAGGASPGFCALGDDSMVYCWGSMGSVLGLNGATALVPTAVTLPFGVTKFARLSSSQAQTYVSALGNDGNTYAWGVYYSDNDWPAGWSWVWNKPTKMPLPTGAMGMRGIGGGNEELYY